MANIVHITTPRLQQMRGLLQSQRTVWLLIMKEGGGLFFCLHYTLCYSVQAFSLVFLGPSIRQVTFPIQHQDQHISQMNDWWARLTKDRAIRKYEQQPLFLLSMLAVLLLARSGYCKCTNFKKDQRANEQKYFSIKIPDNYRHSVSGFGDLQLCLVVGGGGQRTGSWGWKGATSNAPNKIFRPSRVTFVVTNKSARKSSCAICSGCRRGDLRTFFLYLHALPLPGDDLWLRRCRSRFIIMARYHRCIIIDCVFNALISLLFWLFWSARDGMGAWTPKIGLGWTVRFHDRADWGGGHRKNKEHCRVEWPLLSGAIHILRWGLITCIWGNKSR